MIRSPQTSYWFWPAAPIRVTDMRWRCRKRDLRKESSWMRMLVETGLGSLTRIWRLTFCATMGRWAGRSAQFAHFLEFFIFRKIFFLDQIIEALRILRVFIRQAAEFIVACKKLIAYLSCHSVNLQRDAKCKR